MYWIAAKINQPALSDCRSLLLASRDQPPGHTAVGMAFLWLPRLRLHKYWPHAKPPRLFPSRHTFSFPFPGNPGHLGLGCWTPKRMPRERCSSWTCSEWWAQCSSRLTAGSGYHRVWKPCKAALPKELGWESVVLLLPGVVIPRGAAGGVESPLWEQGGDWGQSGEKRQGWNDH